MEQYMNISAIAIAMIQGQKKNPVIRLTVYRGSLSVACVWSMQREKRILKHNKIA